MIYRELPPVEDLWEWFEYAPLSGKLYWRKSPGGGSFAGDEICNVSIRGYARVGFLYNRYLAHRIIWKFMTRQDPVELHVDHVRDYVEGVYKSNNWWNLRLATVADNIANSGKRTNNRSGYKGVFPSKSRWSSQICRNGRKYCLGTFDTPEEAHEAYCQKSLELNGEFARFA